MFRNGRGNVASEDDCGYLNWKVVGTAALSRVQSPPFAKSGSPPV